MLANGKHKGLLLIARQSVPYTHVPTHIYQLMVVLMVLHVHISTIIALVSLPVWSMLRYLGNTCTGRLFLNSEGKKEGKTDRRALFICCDRPQMHVLFSFLFHASPATVTYDVTESITRDGVPSRNQNRRNG